jgi:surface protein
MFSGCTALTQAPELPATTLVDNCYNYMFQDCTSLNSINVNFTDWNIYATIEWLKGVSRSGIFTCPEGLPISRGSDGIPIFWSVVHK